MFTTICVLTMRTPPGDMKIPLPIIDPTMTVTPLSRDIFAFNSIVLLSDFFLSGEFIFSGVSGISFRGTIS